ncbi:MAG TPA: Na/Pi cotransporter family protein [Dysgonamonadaceae bacterium]|nr:Na/Pi cotransporter family protein [Dysgonamonadaceae bacterium]
MSYTFFNFLELVGSLGLFLYGMKIMSEGLQKIAGEQLRSILAAMTRNRVMGVFTGIMVTALIQSSSAASVMVVSFVNAGLLTLAQSIGVIMGANVGTTITAWMISLFGFGKFSISIISIPLLGVGLPLIFSSKSKRKSLGEFIFGFAFLFLGLDLLKNSMPDLQNNPEVLAFVSGFSDLGFLSTLIFLVIGTVLTIIVQSSSATVAITLIMCSRGWIGFESAAAMIMGENIGTTITANIAAYSANVSAKRAAFAHLMFNVLGVIWMLFIFKFFVNMVSGLTESFWGTDPTGMENFVATLSPQEFRSITTLKASELSADLVAKQGIYQSYEAVTSYGLSLYHSMFNIGNVLIMIWFVNLYERICKFVIKPKDEDADEMFQLQFITTGMLSTAELSILQAEKELNVYAKRTRKMFKLVQKLPSATDEVNFVKLFSRIEKYEEISDRMEIEIGSYLNRVAEGRLSNQSKERIRSILRDVTEIESIADSCHNMARHYKRKIEAKAVFTEEIEENIRLMWRELEKAYDKMQEVLEKQEVSDADMTDSIKYENRINELRNMLKRKNIESINDNLYDYKTGVFYMDIVVECEHMGDYIINVVQSVESGQFVRK